ncbi:hypothetical protein ZPAH1_orf00321 [Aeromonas phage ZPAH1]|nr:hypothetical protein ZPAH1_orf00321 [Aeromonas phage ZPAH1]
MLVSKLDLCRDLYDQVCKMALCIHSDIKDDQNRLVLPPVEYQQEFACLSIDLGRQTGKTTFIVESLLKNPNSIAIVNKEIWVREYEHIEPSLKGRVFSPSGFINKFYSRGSTEHVVFGRNIPKHDIVFLDEPYFFCTQGQMNYTNREHCTYPSKMSLKSLILYASYQFGAVNVMVGMK